MLVRRSDRQSEEAATSRRCVSSRAASASAALPRSPWSSRPGSRWPPTFSLWYSDILRFKLVVLVLVAVLLALHVLTEPCRLLQRRRRLAACRLARRQAHLRLTRRLAAESVRAADGDVRYTCTKGRAPIWSSGPGIFAEVVSISSTRSAGVSDSAYFIKSIGLRPTFDLLLGARRGLHFFGRASSGEALIGLWFCRNRRFTTVGDGRTPGRIERRVGGFGSACGVLSSPRLLGGDG
jgi:hypothetical protein